MQHDQRLGVVCALFVVLSLACMIQPARGALLYEQRPDLDAPAIAGHGASWRQGFGIPYETADDFVLLTPPPPITSITFWGIPTRGTDTSFKITFYSNDTSGPFDKPGSVIHSTDALMISRTEVEPITPTNSEVFRYEADLEATFHAEADTTYWLAVFNADPPTAWAWLNSNEFGEVALRNLTPALPYPPMSGNLPWQLDRFDAAFELRSLAPVPEPASLVLLGIGIATAFLRLRRRG